MSARITPVTSQNKKYNILLNHLTNIIKVIDKSIQLAIVYSITLENKLDEHLDDRKAIAVGILVTKAKQALQTNNKADAKEYIYSAITVLTSRR